VRWTVAVCALISLFTLQDASPRIHKQGKIDLYDAGAADLDKDRESITVCVDCEEPVVQPTDSFKGSDFWFQSGRRRYFHPQYGARFAKVNYGATGYSYCANAVYKRGSIRIDQLPSDAQICVRTDEGRYAAIQIIRYIPESGKLSISYTTWEK
jgi:hypothetical protein